MNYDTAEFKTNEEAIDALLSLPNSLSAAPQSTVLDMPLSASVSPALSEGSRQAPSWEIQTPNLRDRLDTALAKARDTISPIERGIWLIEAQNLCERLVDRFAVCSCGLPYDALSERCEACDERHEQLMADRARFGAMADQRDAGVPF